MKINLLLPRLRQNYIAKAQSTQGNKSVNFIFLRSKEFGDRQIFRGGNGLIISIYSYV